MLKKVPIAVLCSGGGTNLQAILDSAAAGAIPSGEVVLVVSDNASAYALERAAKAGVETAVFDRKAVPSRAEREEKILSVLQEKQIGLVILAGFMTILSEKFTRAFENRIINVHPSLIPSFCGPGFYGLKVHEAALARGVKVTGATVHYHLAEGGERGRGRYARNAAKARHARSGVENSSRRSGDRLQKTVAGINSRIFSSKGTTKFRDLRGRLRVRRRLTAPSSLCANLRGLQL